jgi:hypothetical protein
VNGGSEPTRGRRLLKTGAWALGGIGSALAFGANVKVEEAKTNIGSWINFFGFDRIPDFLLSSKTDLAGMVLGLVGVVLAAFFYWRATKIENAIQLAKEGAKEAPVAAARPIIVEGVPLNQPRDLPGHGRGGFDDY